MSERRRYPRYSIKLPLHFRILDSPNDNTKKYGKFWTTDVSLGGVRFETRENLTHDTKLSIELHLPKKRFSDFLTQKPMQIKAKVVWSGKNRNTYEVGLEFLAILEQEQARIEECLQFFLAKEGWDQ